MTFSILCDKYKAKCNEFLLIVDLQKLLLFPVKNINRDKLIRYTVIEKLCLNVLLWNAHRKSSTECPSSFTSLKKTQCNRIPVDSIENF